jgi:probable F420-dependent oxidoreductase
VTDPSATFRFSAAMPPLARFDQWSDALRRIEDLGFWSASISDHFTRGWQMDPLVAMSAAIAATTSLRILSLVLAADYRHPVQTHKALATMDVLSGGRVEIGLGAGFLESEYRAAGLTFLPFARRVERLAETIEVIDALFGDAPVDHDGRYFHLEGLDGLPKPVQRPRPPLLLGGYADRLLDLAGRSADIVGIFPRIHEGADREDAIRAVATETVEAKVACVRAAAARAGRRPADLRLQLSVLAVHLTDVQERGWCSSLLPSDLLDVESVRRSPAVLVGTLDECVQKLGEARERLGFSYLNIGGPPEGVEPLVARLAGR